MHDDTDSHLRSAGGLGKNRRRVEEGERGRLQAHDPFELIRWLALSQPDPRKALAELVQNSLDASARRIRMTRVREKGVPCLKILDDGEGVIPEMDRPSALRYIATHIGHSRKRDLSPGERLQLMTQGQYGIGLLGFWSLGESLEIRSSLPGQRPHRLIIHRERPDFEIQPLKGRLPLAERWTEVVVVGLHREAMAALGGRRAAEYLASELRGQLLSREGLDMVVEDRMSRGRAQKIVPVRPRRFLGERLEGLGPIDVGCYPPIRLEVYLAGENPEDDAQPHLSVYASGTLIADDFHELAALGLDHSPWTDPRLSGIVDFPGFQVAPGSRRGVLPDDAAGAFARALVAIEPHFRTILESLELRRTEEMDRTLVRDLQQAFRDFHRYQPGYVMPPVRSKGHTGIDAAEGGADGKEGAEGVAAEGAPAAEGIEAEFNDAAPIDVTPVPSATLLPPGPLASVRLTPSPLRVECGGSRRARAAAVDKAGHILDAPVSFEWTLEGSVGSLEHPGGSAPAGTSGRVLLKASDVPAEGALSVIARSGQAEVAASVRVEVVDQITSRSSEGVPEPELMHEPAGRWRSRMIEGRWQVNSGHREYRAILDRPTLKLRYFALLFAKEIVLQSSQDLRFEDPLEQMIEVAAYADRRFAERRGPRRKRGPDADDGDGAEQPER